MGTRSCVTYTSRSFHPRSELVLSHLCTVFKIPPPNSDWSPSDRISEHHIGVVKRRLHASAPAQICAWHIQPARLTHKARCQNITDRKEGGTSIEMRPPGLSAVRLIALLFCVYNNHVTSAATGSKPGIRRE